MVGVDSIAWSADASGISGGSTLFVKAVANSDPFFTPTTLPARRLAAHLRRPRLSSATSLPKCTLVADVRAAPRAASSYSLAHAIPASGPPIHRHRWAQESASREDLQGSARQPRRSH